MSSYTYSVFSEIVDFGLCANNLLGDALYVKSIRSQRSPGEGYVLTHVCLPDQIPRYILTLHELLAHTPHEHVERTSLDYAKSKLEELSRYNITLHCYRLKVKYS